MSFVPPFTPLRPDQLVYQALNYTKQRDLEDNITQQEYAEFVLKLRDQHQQDLKEKVRQLITDMNFRYLVSYIRQ